jgi:maleamate amidohydrolase
MADASQEMDERVYDPSYDFNFSIERPLDLLRHAAGELLTKHRVDTVIVAGCNTSGCVRASIVDAFSYGYRVIVAEDCCGDVEKGPHDRNLEDCARRYCDVMSSADVIAYLNRRIHPGRRNALVRG